ncbi:MAG: riboflavin synthase [Candidatus Sericytochromatia bacterium]|nr:riboflavin synthase [Candidatus Sericytochromatia bacterium]
MFTGLIETVGTVVSRQGPSVTIAAPAIAADLVLGESVACSGICLTVTGIQGDRFTVDVSPTTDGLTTSGDWQTGAQLNLERAMILGGRLGGHLVSGHVDGVGKLLKARQIGEGATKLAFQIPEAIAAASIPLGSITVDGVSLTINELGAGTCTVTVIPHTASQTTLLSLRPGTRVNLEGDLLGKYVARLMQGGIGHHHQSGITWEQLAEQGYTNG